MKILKRYLSKRLISSLAYFQFCVYASFLISAFMVLMGFAFDRIAIIYAMFVFIVALVALDIKNKHIKKKAIIQIPFIIGPFEKGVKKFVGSFPDDLLTDITAYFYTIYSNKKGESVNNDQALEHVVATYKNRDAMLDACVGMLVEAKASVDARKAVETANPTDKGRVIIPSIPVIGQEKALAIPVSGGPADTSTTSVITSPSSEKNQALTAKIEVSGGFDAGKLPADLPASGVSAGTDGFTVTYNTMFIDERPFNEGETVNLIFTGVDGTINERKAKSTKIVNGAFVVKNVEVSEGMEEEFADVTYRIHF